MIARLPAYLNGCQDDWRVDPRAANLQWFRQTGQGLFLHFSPASLLAAGKQGWQMIDTAYQQIHRRFHEFDDREYAYWLDTIFTAVAIDPAMQAVWDRFSADRFDADAIAELAVAAGMKYVNITTRHVMGRMFLFKSRSSPCNSVDLPPHRDFVGELSEACATRRRHSARPSRYGSESCRPKARTPWGWKDSSNAKSERRSPMRIAAFPRRDSDQMWGDLPPLSKPCHA